jgi:preprotein translocase subunit YajC
MNNGMMDLIFLGAAAPQPKGPDLIQTVGFMVIIFALFYFMMIRPQMKKEKERRKMVESLKSGDRILFAGGLLGTVANIKDQTVMVKIADTVKIEIARGSIVRILEKDEQPGELEKSN